MFVWCGNDFIMRKEHPSIPVVLIIDKFRYQAPQDVQAKVHRHNPRQKPAKHINLMQCAWHALVHALVATWRLCRLQTTPGKRRILLREAASLSSESLHMENCEGRSSSRWFPTSTLCNPPSSNN